MADRVSDAAALVEDWAGLRRLARSLVRGDAEAEDVVQAAYAAVVAGAAPTRGGDLGAWMRGVVRRVARKHNRTEVRRRQRETRVAMAGGDRSTPSPDQATERLEERRVVLEALQGLPAAQRHALYLRFFEDLSPTEIAARLDVPLPTVKSWLHRGLESLRATLDERHGGKRAVWMAALLPWGEGPGARSIPSPVSLGSTTAWKLVGSVAVCAALGFGGPRLLPSSSDGEGRPDLASEETPGLAGLETLRGAGSRPGSSGAGAPDAAAPLAFAIEGRVVDEARRPVAGATVTVRPKHGAESIVRTDATGRFRSTGLERPGAKIPYLVTARARASGAVSIVWVAPAYPWIAGAEAPYDAGDLPLRPEAELAVSVSDERGAGVEARLRLVPDRNYAPTLAEVSADLGGRATFRQVPAGRYRLVAEGGDLGRATLDLDVPRAGRAPAELRLVPGSTLDVRVVEVASGDPIPGALVRLREYGQEAGGGRGSVHWSGGTSPPADARGRTRLAGVDRSAEVLDLAVEAPGFVATRVLRRWPDAGPLTVELGRARTVRWRIMPGPCPAPAEGAILPLLFSSGREGVLAARVEAGSIVVSDIPEDRFDALALTSDDAGAELSWIASDGREPTATVRRTLAVNLVLERHDGSPAAGCDVWVTPTGSRCSRAFRTDATGRVRLESLPSASFVLRARHGPGQNDAEGLQFPVYGRLSDPLRVRLGRESTCRVSLRLGGRPLHLPGDDLGRVRVVHEERHVPFTWDDREEGTIRFSVAARPTIVVAGDPADSTPASLAEPLLLVRGCLPVVLRLGGADAGGVVPLSVDLQPAGALVVHLHGPTRGTWRPDPVTWDGVLQRFEGGYEPRIERWEEGAGVWASLPSSGAKRGELLGAADAPVRSWRIGLLPAGRYRVVDPATNVSSGGVDVEAGRPPPSVDLDLSKVYEIEGKVALPPGFDVDGAWIEVEDAEGPSQGIGPGGGPVLHAPVGPEGSFLVRLGTLEAVRLTVRHPSLVPDPVEGQQTAKGPLPRVTLRLVGGALAHLRVALPGPLRPGAGADGLLGRVLLYDAAPAGTPTGQSLLHLVPVAGSGRAPMLEATFQGYRPGTYTLWIDVPGFAPAVVEGVALGEGSSVIGPVALARGSSLLLRTSGGAGRFRQAVRVTAEGIGEPGTVRTWSSDDGPDAEWALAGLPAGRHRVRVEIRSERGGTWASLRPDEDVVLDGRTDVSLEIRLP